MYCTELLCFCFYLLEVFTTNYRSWRVWDCGKVYRSYQGRSRDYRSPSSRDCECPQQVDIYLVLIPPRREDEDEFTRKRSTSMSSWQSVRGNEVMKRPMSQFVRNGPVGAAAMLLGKNEWRCRGGITSSCWRPALRMFGCCRSRRVGSLKMPGQYVQLVFTVICQQ